MEVYLLANLASSDNSTVMGKTLSRLKRELGCQVLSSGLVKKNMEYFPTPDGEKWRLGFIEELLDVKSNKMTIENFSHIDVQNMIAALCTT